MASLPPLDMDQLVNFIYAFYYFVRELIAKLFEYTIFKGEPDLAILYSDAFTILISLTAIYLVLELFTAARKFVKFFLIIGWFLLVVSMVIGSL